MFCPRPRRSDALAAFVLALGVRQEPPPFRAPAPPPLGPVTIEVRARTVTLLHAPGPEDDETLAAGPYPLATALRAARTIADPVLGIHGEIPGTGLTIGGGDAGQKSYVVHWDDTPMRFALVGMTEDARIREFAVWQRMNDGRENGGVVDARFEKLTIEARFTSCVSTPKGQSFGILRFYGCRFVPGRENLAEGAYVGFGAKWGVRSQARGRYDFRGCTFEPVQEHALYLDSPQGDSTFVGNAHRGSTRTAIQIVNRCFDNPGPSGHGTLLFEELEIVAPWGDGGSALTVAGHLGDVLVRGVRVREDPARQRSHGAIAVWTDASPEHGAHLAPGADGRLFSTRAVTIESLEVDLPHADRPHVAIAGAERVVVQGFTIAGNQAAFALDSPFGAPVISGPACVGGEKKILAGERVTNGTVRFAPPPPLSRYPGFRAAAKVVLGGETRGDERIDALSLTERSAAGR